MLLDSILCSMGALMCCMLYVPELNSSEEGENGESPNQESKKLFQGIIDNVHYIMPGL